MQFRTFSHFVLIVKHEGNKYQKVSVNGETMTKARFTTMQYIAILIACLGLLLLPKGFDDKFAGYTISFLGIFIGMFASALIALNNKSVRIQQEIDADKKDPQKSQIDYLFLRQGRNHIIQFTALTSYTILLAFIIIILMLLSLVHDVFERDMCNYIFVRPTKSSVGVFIGNSALLLHRFLALYFFSNFFFVTIYSITSYFSYLLTEHKKIDLKND